MQFMLVASVHHHQKPTSNQIKSHLFVSVASIARFHHMLTAPSERSYVCHYQSLYNASSHSRQSKTLSPRESHNICFHPHKNPTNLASIPRDSCWICCVPVITAQHFVCSFLKAMLRYVLCRDAESLELPMSRFLWQEMKYVWWHYHPCNRNTTNLSVSMSLEVFLLPCNMKDDDDDGCCRHFITLFLLHQQRQHTPGHWQLKLYNLTDSWALNDNQHHISTLTHSLTHWLLVSTISSDVTVNVHSSTRHKHVPCTRVYLSLLSPGTMLASFSHNWFWQGTVPDHRGA